MHIGTYRYHQQGTNVCTIDSKNGSFQYDIDLKDPSASIAVKVDPAVEDSYLKQLDGLQARGLRDLQVHVDQILDPVHSKVQTLRRWGLVLAAAGAAGAIGSVIAEATVPALLGVGATLAGLAVAGPVAQSALGPGAPANDLGWHLTDWRNHLAECGLKGPQPDGVQITLSGHRSQSWHHFGTGFLEAADAKAAR